MHRCMYVWLYGCMVVWLYGCMVVCMYVCIYALVYIYIYILILLICCTCVHVMRMSLHTHCDRFTFPSREPGAAEIFFRKLKSFPGDAPPIFVRLNRVYINTYMLICLSLVLSKHFFKYLSLIHRTWIAFTSFIYGATRSILSVQPSSISLRPWHKSFCLGRREGARQ